MTKPDDVVHQQLEEADAVQAGSSGRCLRQQGVPHHGGIEEDAIDGVEIDVLIEQPYQSVTLDAVKNGRVVDAGVECCGTHFPDVVQTCIARFERSPVLDRIDTRIHANPFEPATLRRVEADKADRPFGQHEGTPRGVESQGYERCLLERRFVRCGGFFDGLAHGHL